MGPPNAKAPGFGGTLSQAQERPGSLWGVSFCSAHLRLLNTPVLRRPECMGDVVVERRVPSGSLVVRGREVRQEKAGRREVYEETKAMRVAQALRSVTAPERALVRPLRWATERVEASAHRGNPCVGSPHDA